MLGPSTSVDPFSVFPPFCTQDQGSAEPGDGFVVQCNWVALFVPPTSKSTSMHLRSTLVRFTPCLAAMDAQLFWTFKMPTKV